MYYNFSGVFEKMEFLKHKIYQYKEIADMIAHDALEHERSMIAVTGTSSVGKSTFSNMLANCLIQYGYSTQILSADNYLNKKYRAGTNFWNRLDSTYLKPEYFDWEQLNHDLNQLINQHSFDKECYVRGTGWGSKKHFSPTEFYIIEGLFLDSIQASKYMHYDRIISLRAKDDIIRTLRMERDNHYRKLSKTFTRTKEETLQEIENTLLAEKSYSHFPNWEHHLVLHVKGSYNATLYIK